MVLFTYLQALSHKPTNNSITAFTASVITFFISSQICTAPSFKASHQPLTAFTIVSHHFGILTTKYPIDLPMALPRTDNIFRIVATPKENIKIIHLTTVAISLPIFFQLIPHPFNLPVIEPKINLINSHKSETASTISVRLSFTISATSLPNHFSNILPIKEFLP